MTVHRIRHRHPLGAILFAVRDRGLAALEEPINVARLRRFDDATLAELNARLDEIVRDRGRQHRLPEPQEQRPPRPRKAPH